MKAMFVNEDESCYAQAIVLGYKTIETRSRNMLKSLVGERVAVVRTKKGERPLVIGTVFVSSFWYEDHPWTLREKTAIPFGSKYDTDGRWMYGLHSPEPISPDSWYPLPENTVRHGRSWCEW